MENAGRGAAALAAKMCRDQGRVAVVAGPGNNGGDGFVISRHLLNMGYEVDTYLAAPRATVRGDPLVNLAVLEKMSGSVFDISTPDKIGRFEENLRSCDVVVDALLGTGVSRGVDGHMGDLIDAMNRSGAKVLAVDVPSGLDADSGRPLGKAVQASVTATFGHLKLGLLLYPGASLAGQIEVIPIGVPGAVSGSVGWSGAVIAEEAVRRLIPRRPLDSHKGTFGHLLALAGSAGKTGAAAMVGKAAMRVGTGLVTVATTAEAQPALEAKCLEVMVDHVLERTDSPISQKAIARLGRLLEGKQAVAIGPGISTEPGMSALAISLLGMLKVPAVIDADCISILANDPNNADRIFAPLVLTPHPGEMARLMGKSVDDIQADRIGAAKNAAKRYKAIVVLKGAHTVIAAPDGGVFVNPTGNPGMASGGMGDVLTGIIGGLLAQGLSPLDAALSGVYLHGLAGDRACKRLGCPGLIASDVIDEIAEILREWTAQER
jgi:NAD(P)H-hydrate epimerase